MIIKIDTVEKIKKYIKIANSFESEIDLKKGHYILDGKSVMGLYSLDLSSPISVELISNDEEELKLFEEKLKEFKCTKGENIKA